jgi:hypothetical protein
MSQFKLLIPFSASMIIAGIVGFWGEYPLDRIQVVVLAMTVAGFASLLTWIFPGRNDVE